MLRIGGIENHVHILVDISSNVSLAEFVKRLKQQSSVWAKHKFILFEGWSKEYAAFSCSNSDKDRIIEYIKMQEEHHRVLSFEEELKNYSPFWQEKLMRNIERDKKVTQALEAEGWRVLRIWESDIRKDLDSCVDLIVSEYNGFIIFCFLLCSSMNFIICPC